MRTRSCVRMDMSVLSPGNFIMDAIVHLSHGQPSGHHPSIRPSVRYCPCDNPNSNSCIVLKVVVNVDKADVANDGIGNIVIAYSKCFV